MFVDNFKGKHFIKEAYQKLAWYELSINNDLAAYKKYMTLCLSKGSELVDEDKQAIKEAKMVKAPNALLLQSRILYDGGYYSRAQSVLIRNAYSLSDDKVTSLEFNYRMGRILQALKNFPDAIEYYGTTLSLGQNTSEYYAASAALQMGIIYEEQKQIKAAKQYYTLCLKLKPNEYRNSLHQKAKSGLDRLK
jgi:tetratricopeptide (TPR) repeat protein